MIVSLTCPRCHGYAYVDADTDPGLTFIKLDDRIAKCTDCGCNYKFNLKVVNVNDRRTKGSGLPMCYKRTKEFDN